MGWPWGWKPHEAGQDGGCGLREEIAYLGIPGSLCPRPAKRMCGLLLDSFPGSKGD